MWHVAYVLIFQAFLNCLLMLLLLSVIVQSIIFSGFTPDYAEAPKCELTGIVIAGFCRCFTFRPNHKCHNTLSLQRIINCPRVPKMSIMPKEGPNLAGRKRARINLKRYIQNFRCFAVLVRESWCLILRCILSVCSGLHHSAPEVSVEDVTLVEREKELAEKEAQVCEKDSLLCVQRDIYYILSRHTVLNCDRNRFWWICYERSGVAPRTCR